MTTTPIQGVWKLLSFHFYTKGDDKNPLFSPLGDKPSGRIIFTSEGYMNATLTSSDVLEPSDQLQWAVAEDDYILNVARPMTTYCGPFTLVKEDGKQLLKTKVDLALDPNWIGGYQVREWELHRVNDNDFLVLKPVQTFPGPVSHFRS